MKLLLLPVGSSFGGSVVLRWPVEQLAARAAMKRRDLRRGVFGAFCASYDRPSQLAPVACTAPALRRCNAVNNASACVGTAVRKGGYVARRAAGDVGRRPARLSHRRHRQQGEETRYSGSQAAS